MADIYVATSSNPLEMAEKLMNDVRSVGHRITHDWTVDIRNAGNNASPDDPVIRGAAAKADLRGIAEANIVWVVQPENPSTGAWVELGFALGKREEQRAYHREYQSNEPILKIVVSGPSKKCIFSDLADHRFASHDDALTFIKEMV